MNHPQSTVSAFHINISSDYKRVYEQPYDTYVPLWKVVRSQAILNLPDENP